MPYEREVVCDDDLTAYYHAWHVAYTSLLKGLADGSASVGEGIPAVDSDNAFSHGS